MKRIATIAAIGLTALSAWAAIEWRVNNEPLFQLKRQDGLTVELGLREDGVVVWRKITNTTNSPAEQVFFYMSWPTNNITLTNIPLHLDNKGGAR